MHFKYQRPLLNVILDNHKVSPIKEVRLSPKDFNSVHNEANSKGYDYEVHKDTLILHGILIIRDEVESDYDYVA